MLRLANGRTLHLGGDSAHPGDDPARLGDDPALELHMRNTSTQTQQTSSAMRLTFSEGSKRSDKWRAEQMHVCRILLVK